MARQPKPWWRKDRKTWCVTINGKRHSLGPDRDAAFKKFHELMARPDATPIKSESVAALMDKFLDWTKANRAPATYDWYLDRCQGFLSFAGNITVDDLKPYHVQEWVDSHSGWGPTYQRGCIAGIQRSLNWALKMGYISQNPIAYVEKPKANRRTDFIAETEYKNLLSFIDDQEFRDLVVTAWETGCRPQEMTAVEARHVDAKNGRWVFSPEESKVKTRPRIIYLSEAVLEITLKRIQRFPTGKLFRNANKTSWDSASLNCRFSRLQLAMGRRAMKEKGIDVSESKVVKLVNTLKPEWRYQGVWRAKTQAELNAEVSRRCMVCDANAVRL